MTAEHLLQGLLAAVGLPANDVRKFELDGKDPFVATRFVDGGGVITYCRSAADGKPAKFVHTFNTEKHFHRKMNSMGFEW